MFLSRLSSLQATKVKNVFKEEKEQEKSTPSSISLWGIVGEKAMHKYVSVCVEWCLPQWEEKSGSVRCF